MKKAVLAITFCIASILCFSQSQTFDNATYIPPKNWKKQVAGNTLQFSKEDVQKGTYCLITLFKMMQGSSDSKENFDLAWTTLVKEMVNVQTAPEMQPVSTENGWEIQSGFAAFENDGNKGIVLLATSTAAESMMNLIILTNSDVYEKEMSAFMESISLKKMEPMAAGKNQQTQNTNSQAKKVDEPNVQSNQTAPNAVSKNGYQFTSSNFDDGWTSVEKDDWVEVTKGNMKVLLHYPTDGIKAANTDVDVMCAAAWNYLVAPRYSNIQGYRVNPGVLDYERPYYAEATVADKVSGATVFVVLFKKATGWMEFIMPDRNTFIQTFGIDISTIDYYMDSQLWNKMKGMSNYNRFAVAASDFTGTWKDRFSANTYYTNIYTGYSAGMSTYSSSQVFQFLPKSSYKWSLVATNSYGGATNFASAKGAGSFKVLNNWQIYFSEMEGKPKTFDAYFSCVKGGRILWLNDAKYPGNGIFTGFSREKE